MAEAVGTDRASLALGDFLSFRLARAANAVSALMARTWSDRFGLSVCAWRLLCVVAESGPVAREAMAELTALSALEAGEAAAELLARGLIVRARLNSLAPTPAGLAAHAELAELALAAEAALIAGLSPVEVHTLNRLLGRLQGAAQRLAAPARLAPSGISDIATPL